VRRLRLGAWLAAMAIALSGCSAAGAGSEPVRLTVLAAASLKGAFPKIGQMFTTAHPGVTLDFSFAGTDALAAQIEQGVPADVFAGASLKFGDELAGKGFIEPYRPFCTNQLVLVLPPANPAGITSLRDLTRPGTKIVVGSETVPIGAYTRTVLVHLNATYGASFASRVVANVVSNEDNVEGVLTKVESGEADAGFVYVTDAKSAGAAVRTISLPAAAQATATYPIAVVKASKHPDVARLFEDFVLSAPAQRVLRDAAFGPPPAG